mgnify:CR=1 FL=1
MANSDAPFSLSVWLQNFDLEHLDQATREKILDFLEPKVSELMDGPREKFFQALYRLDVNEERAQQIMSGTLLSSKKISKARALSELILDRELKKWKTRQQE